MKHLVVSIHDVSPQTLVRVRALRSMIGARVDGPVSLLVVPRLHGRHPWDRASADVLLDLAAGGDELVLHGHTHLAAEGDERELRGVALDEARDRIAAGLREMAEVDVSFSGFVPPCYVNPSGLGSACEANGLSWWATRGWLHWPNGWQCLPSVGVGASTAVKRAGSPSVAFAFARALTAASCVRLDLHPADVEHPRLTMAGLRLLDLLLDQGRHLATHAEIVGERPAAPAPAGIGMSASV